MNKIIFTFWCWIILIPSCLLGQGARHVNSAKQDTSSVHAHSHATDSANTSILYWRITERTGEIVSGNPDTTLTDYPNRTHVDGQSVAMAYLGNLGLPMESRIYFDRMNRSNFMFMDPFYNYTMTPDKHNFINTKIPYANVSYQTAGSRENKEERLLGALSVNFGKKLNVGVNVDYLYARGFYKSQSAKHLEWGFYGSYIADRHQIHAFINPANYTNAENGGITNDLAVTNPTAVYNRKILPREMDVNFENTWNHMKGTRYYFNYRYDLGYEKESSQHDEEGTKTHHFIPVSSIIYTFDYTDKNRKFYSKDSAGVDDYYKYRKDSWGYNNRIVNDSTSYWSLKNTIGLSLREGFSQWVKFDLTAFLTQDFRSYNMMSKDFVGENSTPASTYIGGEISKRTGKFLRYTAQGDFGVIGYNIGNFNLVGRIETRVPLFNDTASIIADGYIKNFSPTFYENHFHGKYFWWDRDFGTIKKAYVGGTIELPHTHTKLGLGVENLTNYLYFDTTAAPNQYGGNIQILAATLTQNFKFGGLHWDNQLVYQTSSNQDILPLPDLSLYSSMYVQFKVAKVLTIQMGGNLHYFSKYYSPTYEPSTQQFYLQKEKMIGEYPLLNAFVNCHLKQTRFFIEFYNLSSSFIRNPEYFSLPHYPLNPQIFKLGLSCDFHN